eukprot:8026577-Lingulodinium_polyedra.AAC.1
MKLYGDLYELGEVGCHPNVLEPGSALGRRFAMRECAREALERHQSADAMARAVAARSRPLREFETGTKVFFYRSYVGKRKERAVHGSYVGPAVVIGKHGEGSLWVRFGGRAYLCA